MEGIEQNIIGRWTLLNTLSFSNAVFFCSLFSVVLWLLCRKTFWMVRLGLKPLCLFVFLAVLRLVLPVELPFSWIVGSRKILVWVQDGFHIRIAQLGGHSIETGDVFLFVWLWGAALLLGRFLWQWARHGRFMAQCPSIPQEMMDQLLELRCDFSVLEKIDTVQQDDYYEMLLGTYRAAREKHSMPEGIAALASSHRHVILQRFQMGGNFSRMEKQSKVARRILMGLMVVLYICSYLIIFQPQGFPPPVEDGHRIYSGPPEGSYLIHHADGTYSVCWEEGQIVPIEDATDEFFADLPVREEGEK